MFDSIRVSRRVKKASRRLGPLTLTASDGVATISYPNGESLGANWRGRKALHEVGLCLPYADDDYIVEVGSHWRTKVSS